MSSLELPEVADLQGLGARDLETVLRDLDTARRQIEMLVAETVCVAETTGVYRDDGHKSVFAWVRAVCNWSIATSRAAVQTARIVHEVPQLREAARAGVVGVDQLRQLAAVYANPRARHSFAESADLLLTHATSLWFDEFKIVAHRWEDLADEDGAHRSHTWEHDHRDARVSVVGDRVYVDARGGVVAGAIVDEVFSRFCDAEFRADWEAALQVSGDQTCAADLARTPAQRRFDAFLAMCVAAAESGRAGRIEPLVNIVVDLETYEHHLAKACGEQVEPLDPRTVDRRRCETIDGHQLDPTDVLAAALVGRVRRVVLDSAGVVVDLGRKRRVFTGSARDAVLLGDRWCTWPGCGLRSGRCQIDHSRPWSHDGETRPDNGGADCGHHNRWKQRGYRTWRDSNGRWHVVRPDGTEIGPFADDAVSACPVAGI
ncbi:MAG TPA: DUF222 domain-containing protein [Ilumatobacteraceae bacterium]